MMKARVLAATAMLLLAGAGCVVVYEEPPPRHRVVYRETVAPAPAPVVVQESPDEVEVNDVVYREYYGCTDEEIYILPHYRHYYALTDDDIYFLYFVARQSNVTFDVCFHSYYYDCGRNYDRLVVSYNVPREHFFVAVGAGVTTYPPVYQRTYACYNSGSYASVTFTNTEYVGLVRMHVACDYQGHPPAAYFARVQVTGSPSRVIVESRDQCGHGGRTATGGSVTVSATRAWTLPPAQKQQWHDQHRQGTVTAEASFKERHPEQVQKVQAREKAAPARTPSAKPAAGTARGSSGEHPASNAPGGAHAKNGTAPAETGPDGRPVEKHPAEAHVPPKRTPPPEEPKKGEKEK
jgi:hypothetical protein